MLPTVTFTGTLVADPDLRFTPSGHAVANLRIACNDRKQENGQWVDADPCFLSLTVWRSLAENLVESAVKGDSVIGKGRLQQRTWQDKDGNNRTSYEVQVDEIGMAVQFRPAKPDRSGGAQQYRPGALAEPPSQANQQESTGPLPW